MTQKSRQRVLRVCGGVRDVISTMDSLERITFDTCHGLTNAGVARLARLPKLRELRVSGRGVTPDLRAAFPSRVEVFCGD